MVFYGLKNAPSLIHLNLDEAGDRLILETFWNDNRVRVDTPIKGLHGKKEYR